MDPKFWGPGLWKFLHATAAVAYTETDIRDFVAFVQSLSLVLPCKVCRNHFKENLKKYQINNYITSNETLFLWTYQMHNAVNEAQEKTGEKKPSFNEVYRMYFNVESDNGAVDFTNDYIDTVCKEVCSGQTAEVKTLKQDPNILVNSSNSRYRKFKTYK